jgi:fucose 4-O-acetylase-like acetyltransferase
MNNRLEYVDIAKGIGIVLVICSHSEALDLMWLFIGMFVPIFYFCAGYTSKLKGTIKASMLKRFQKLFVPYVFFNVVMFCVFEHFSLREVFGILYSRYCLYPLDVTPNIKFLTSGNYPMWFLTSMIVSYLLFYLIIYYEKYKWWTIGAYAIITKLLTFCPILLPWSIDTAFLTALFMYMGMLARKLGCMDWGKWPIIFFLVIYIVLHCVAGDINLSVRMYGTSVALYFVLGTLGSFLMLWGSKFLEQTSAGKILLVLGRHSLSIFCVQMAFIVMVKNMWHLLLPNIPYSYLTGFLEIVVALVGGWIVSVLIHKSRLLSRILQ